MYPGLQHHINTILKEPVLKIHSVSGGDINEAWCLQSQHHTWFVKLNDAQQFPNMFSGEADGLRALKQHSTFYIPEVIATGEWEGQQYLILEWISSGTPSTKTYEVFGSMLATMHQQPQEFFGWHQHNYIGSLPQQNNTCNTWHEFYAQQRILPLVQRLFDAAIFDATDVLYAEQLCNKLKEIFPAETPSLLHGDLWSGNYMIHQNGSPVLIDPAVYCGHREMDIGMMHLFDGFPAAVIQSYNEHHPLQKGWQSRLPVTQWYPLLVHAILFGGHYVQQCRNIAATFVN
ncbi:MAG: fructosamine kinase family protein [Bacteroidetes bacterium]|nr:fructosamine kinase family protein [Bacteroidota bacterium]